MKRIGRLAKTYASSCGPACDPVKPIIIQAFEEGFRSARDQIVALIKEGEAFYRKEYGADSMSRKTATRMRENFVELGEEEEK